MFKINYSWGNAHWIVPPIIIGVLCVLFVLILIRRALKCAKDHTPFINLHYHFFVENWDKLKLIGCLVLLLLYPIAMQAIHFLPASIIFIFLFNVLFCGVDKLEMIKQGGGLKNEGLKSVLVSLLISVIASVLIWFIFGTIFRVTLP